MPKINDALVFSDGEQKLPPRRKRAGISARSVEARKNNQKKLIKQGYDKGMSMHAISKYAKASEAKIREVLTSKSPDIEKAFRTKAELATMCSAQADVAFSERAHTMKPIDAAKASALYAKQAQDLKNNSTQYGNNINMVVFMKVLDNVNKVEKALKQCGVDPVTLVDPEDRGIELQPLPVLPTVIEDVTGEG